jgi:hypothetical protein
VGQPREIVDGARPRIGRLIDAPLARDSDLLPVCQSQAAAFEVTATSGTNPLD